MPTSEVTHSEKAYQYALDILSEEIPAGRFVKLACQRFIDDFDRDEFYYDAEQANRACRFYETLPHVKDYWGLKKQKLKLEPWQCFTECNIFGWYWNDGSGKRRFLESYEEIPRKNGKSFKLAARGAYTFCADSVFGAEVYSGASSERQAMEVFRPIKQIFERTPALRDKFGVDVHAKNLSIASNGSRCEPLVGGERLGDGQSPSHAICDEYHEHATDALALTMMQGMAARAMHGSPLLSYITTAGSNLSGPCFEKRMSVIKILEGQYQDDTVFGILYTIDEDTPWDSEEALEMANPNLGVSVSKKFLLAQLEQAKRSATKQVEYKTKHLNMWVGAKAIWMNMLAWQRQARPNAYDKFKGLPCHVSVDLASRKDVAVKCVTFKDEESGEYYSQFKFYVPESAVEQNDKYREYETAGELIVTPGSMTDQSFIEEDIKDDCKNLDVRSIAFDDWQADYMMTRLLDCRLPVVNFNQTVKNMSTPMKETEALVLDRKLWHDGSKTMSWMMGNVAAKIDAKQHIYPRKENDNDPNCKIDGAVCLIMGVGRWLAEEPETTVYNKRGLRTF